MQLLETYHHQTEALLALARLRGAGIRCMLRHDTIHGILPVSALAVQLWVHPEDLEAAAALLAREAEEDELPEDYREIGSEEIRFLQRQARRRRYRFWLWLLLAVLIALLVMVGWS